jgi:hypothetical protein
MDASSLEKQADPCIETVFIDTRFLDMSLIYYIINLSALRDRVITYTNTRSQFENTV